MNSTEKSQSDKEKKGRNIKTDRDKSKNQDNGNYERISVSENKMFKEGPRDRDRKRQIVTKKNIETDRDEQK